MNFPDDVWMTGAESEVRQALLNVLMNAADAVKGCRVDRRRTPGRRRLDRGS